MSSTDSCIMTINAANSTVTNNNTFEYKLKAAINLQDMEVSLVKGFIFNSAFNVNASQYQNQSYQYTWPNGSGVNTYTITMPNGFYDIDIGINGYLENQMKLNKTYLVDSNGDPVYYLRLASNTTYYSCTLTASPLPSTLPSGYSIPEEATWSLPVTAQTPQFMLSEANINMGKLIGFTAGTYPATPQATTYEVNATKTPQISPQYAFNICLNIVNLPYVNSVPNMIYPFSFTQSFGSQEILDPYQSKYYSVTNGIYSEITLSIVDQSNSPALLLDPSSSFTIELRRKQTLKHLKY